MKRRGAAARSSLPFVEAEDQRLIDMASCGLSVEFYPDALPWRTLPELLERRLVLREQGKLSIAPTI